MSSGREILFVNLTVYDSRNRLQEIKKVVITRGDSYYKKQTIASVEVIKILGFTNTKGNE